MAKDQGNKKPEVKKEKKPFSRLLMLGLHHIDVKVNQMY